MKKLPALFWNIWKIINYNSRIQATTGRSKKTSTTSKSIWINHAVFGESKKFTKTTRQFNSSRNSEWTEADDAVACLLPMSTRNNRILHIDGDSFFASCEFALDPKLAGRPVWVGGGILE